MILLRPADIAVWLPAYIQANRDAEREALKTLPNTVAKHAAHVVMDCAGNRLETAGDLIMALPAATLADAAAQVMVAASRVAVMKDLGGDDEQACKAIEWALHSALGVILQAAGMTLDPVTVEFYLPFATIPGVARVEA